jgi:hypothetical protein
MWLNFLHIFNYASNLFSFSSIACKLQQAAMEVLSDTWVKGFNLRFIYIFKAI